MIAVVGFGRSRPGFSFRPTKQTVGEIETGSGILLIQLEQVGTRGLVGVWEATRQAGGRFCDQTPMNKAKKKEQRDNADDCSSERIAQWIDSSAFFSYVESDSLHSISFRLSFATNVRTRIHAIPSDC